MALAQSAAIVRQRLLLNLNRVDLYGAFAGEVRPDSPCPLALLKPNDRTNSSLGAAIEMQSQVFA